VASRRTLSPRRLHRHEHEPPGRTRRCFLQQTRTCEQWIAYNLGDFLRTLATPEPIKDWSLTSLKDKLIKIGAKVVSYGRYVIFQMAEVASRNLATISSGLYRFLAITALLDVKDIPQVGPLQWGRISHRMANVPGDFATYRGTALLPPSAPT
jgi:hypothetical protein